TLRICDELYYHCQNSSKYIEELKSALRDVGLDLDDKVAGRGRRKTGGVAGAGGTAAGLAATEGILTGCGTHAVASVLGTNLDKLRAITKHGYSYKAYTGSSEVEALFEATVNDVDSIATNMGNIGEGVHIYKTTFAKLAKLNYAIVQRASAKFYELRFDRIKKSFPEVTSLREFLCDSKYLGGVKLEITSMEADPAPQILYEACLHAFETIAPQLDQFR
ncbi:MAG: hypothetical protein J6Z22_08710, partial [Lachnospiraceae bacterium]|nr:hypothetical protein [Lachnospiraceae bacterium]